MERNRKPKDDLAGKTFNKLLVIKYEKKKGWLCKCECGNIKYVSSNDLKRGHTTSCGCNLKNNKWSSIKNEPLYKELYSRWKQMKQRCYRKKNDNYKFYGGKGIRVCDEWKNNFGNFFDWSIKNGYSKELQLDRINAKDNYSPDNCRWIDAFENRQRANKGRSSLDYKMLELSSISNDDIVNNYINRKIEQAEKDKNNCVSHKLFFYHRPSYCILHNYDNTKQFLFTRYKDVALFLEISYGAVNYRINKKEGIINNEWKLEKLTKEEYDNFKIKRKVEVI